MYTLVLSIKILIQYFSLLKMCIHFYTTFTNLSHLQIYIHKYVYVHLLWDRCMFEVILKLCESLKIYIELIYQLNGAAESRQCTSGSGLTLSVSI